ncbi:MAG: hypothetical protein WC814_02060 [Candidatus Paceibacterota bacterium]
MAYVLLVMEDLGLYQEGPLASLPPKEKELVMKDSKVEDWLDGLFFAGALIVFGLGSLFKKAAAYVWPKR